MILIKDLARVNCVYLHPAQPLICAPECRVLLECVFVHLNGLASLHLSLIDLSQKKQAGGTVRDLLEQILL